MPVLWMYGFDNARIRGRCRYEVNLIPITLSNYGYADFAQLIFV